MGENGSAYPRFEMDENREYLSVILPVHPYFLPNTMAKSKDSAYKEKIVDALREKTITLNELAKALGYKSISKKLSNAVNEMLQEGILVRVVGKGRYPVIALD